MSTPTARLAMVTLDCADPEEAAAFWSALLGWDVAHSEKDYAMLKGPEHALGFGRVEEYAARRGRTSTAASSSTSTSRWRTSTRRQAERRRARCDGRRPAARGDLAGAPRPGGPPVLPHEGRELGLTAGRLGPRPGARGPLARWVLPAARTCGSAPTDTWRRSAPPRPDAGSTSTTRTGGPDGTSSSTSGSCSWAGCPRLLHRPPGDRALRAGGHDHPVGPAAGRPTRTSARRPRSGRRSGCSDPLPDHLTPVSGPIERFGVWFRGSCRWRLATSSATAA